MENFFVFTVFTETIIHLVYPPKFCITLVFHFSWDDCNTWEKLDKMVEQNFRGKQCVL